MIKVSEYHVAYYLANIVENYFTENYNYRYSLKQNNRYSFEAVSNNYFALIQTLNMFDMTIQTELKEIKNLYRNYRKHVIKYNAWSDKYGDDVSFSTLLAQYLQHIFENCE